MPSSPLRQKIAHRAERLSFWLGVTAFLILGAAFLFYVLGNTIACVVLGGLAFVVFITALIATAYWIDLRRRQD